MNIENSILNANTESRKDVVDDMRFSLKAARKLQADRREYGVDRVDLYFEDVDGDWLEEWDDDDDDLSA